MIVSTTWQHFQVRFSEWFGATCLFAWGVYLTLHPEMMTNPKNGEVFHGMLDIMPQPSWGLAGTIVGMARLAALYVNGHHTRTPTIRLATSFVSALVWTQVLVGFYKSGFANPGIVLYTCLIAADIYSAFRASGDVTLLSRRLRQDNEGARGAGTSQTYS